MKPAQALFHPHFAERITRLRSSPIRDILSVIDQPGMISFAGGLPDPDSFPDLSAEIPRAYLQYGPSEGESELREQVSQELSKRGLDCPPDSILILSGSQQGIDLVAKLFVERNAKIALESPTYLAALQVFDLFEAEYQSLEAISEETALAYVIPTFQNPTGHCYPLEQREQVAASCDSTSTVLFEDDPYAELFYEDVCRQPVCSLLKRASWIYQGSFSKTLCPGLRQGYLACSKDLFPYLCRLKQASDLHSSRVSQYLILDLYKRANYEERLNEVRNRYREKRDAFDAMLGAHLAPFASWKRPAGGLFFWLELQRNNIDMDQLFRECIANGVAFMPGNHFFPHSESDRSYMRLNFSHANQEQAETGLRKLAAVIGAR